MQSTKTPTKQAPSGNMPVRSLPEATHFRLALAVSGALTIQTSQAAATAVGAIPGSLAVTPTGSAAYSIPIAVPPGMAGMVPSLATGLQQPGKRWPDGMRWTLGSACCN